MTKFFIVSATTVFATFFLNGCTNEPAEFSQASGSTKTISIKVESPSDAEASAAAEENQETTNPAIAAGESKLDALFEGFDSAGTEGFNPDGYFDDGDIETSEDPNKVEDSTDSDSSSTNTTDTTATTADSGTNNTDTASTSSSDTTSTTTSTTPPSTSDTPANPTDAGKEVANKSEVALCAKISGVKPEKVVLERPTSIKSGSVIAIKVNGNNEETVLDLAGDANAALRGICVFSAGNQLKFSSKLALKVENFLFVGRGNQGKGDVVVEGNGAITAVVISLKGNANTFHFKSNGKPNCADIYDIAKDGSFTCE